MPMTMCAACSKMISISHLPGGNPIAAANPEMFAMSYGECDRCGAAYCDKCINSNGGKCPGGCGRRIDIKAKPEGVAAPLPPEYSELLKKLESESFSTTKSRPERRASKAKVSGTVARGREWRFLIGLAVVLGLAFGMTQVTAADSTMNRLSWILLNGLGVLTVFVVVSPAVGNLLTATIGEVFRRLLSREGMIKLVRFWILFYLVALLLSPWFIYHAHYAWQMQAWRIAYAYAAIVGALLGGIILLGKYAASLREGR